MRQLFALEGNRVDALVVEAEAEPGIEGASHRNRDRRGRAEALAEGQVAVDIDAPGCPGHAEFREQATNELIRQVVRQLGSLG